MSGVAIVVFSDLVDSTALLARLGDDRMDSVRRAHVVDVTVAVTGNGGRLVKTLGDGAMASFESALGALRAAAAIQAAVERLDGEQGGIGLAARVGVAAGEPIADGDDLHGMPVVIASRLSSAAGTGEVLVQDLVQALVASRDGVLLGEAGEYELKGVPAPVRASQLLWRELKDEGDREPESAARNRDDRGRADRIRLPPVLAAYADEPLIGRDREIDGLREATAPRDRCRAVLILGEPGIGKTRHAAAAAAEAHAEGAVVVLARCPPEPTIAFEPWVRAIGELALAGDAAWRTALAKAAGAELAALVPELSEQATLAERVAVDEVVAAEGARYRLLRGIGAALAFAAGEASLHVVLDDAHWCDPASAQALRQLLESPPARLVLVVTARDREMDRRHPVSKALSDLRRTGDLTELRLTGLDASGLAALVGAKVGRAITPGLAQQLQARTSGNPFFAGELARDLDGQGALQAGEVLEQAPAPEAVTDLVEERLARLSPDTERLLVSVAAIGPAAPVALAAKAAGLGTEEAERAVEEALSQRLIDDVVAAEPTIGFPHALIREALIAETGEADRARLHFAIARALEESPGAEPAELARHYGLSTELAGIEPTIAAHRAAAAAAAAGHDHEGAAAHLHQILSLLPEAELAARASTLLDLGEQEFLSANMARAREAFLGAVEVARATGESATLARAALGFAGGDVGFGWESGGDDPASVALLQESLDALGDAEPLIALRITFRLTYLSIYTDDDEVPAALARRAQDLEQRLGDAEARVLAQFTVLVTRFTRRADPLDIEGLFRDLESVLDLVASAEESGREDLLFRVVQWSAVVHYIMARIPECERAVERGAEIAARLGSPRFAWEVDFNRAMRLFDRGRCDEAKVLMRRAGEVVRRLRPDIHIFAELSLATTASWIYGGNAEMQRFAFEAMDVEMPRGFVLAARAAATANAGDLETARARLRSLLEDDLEQARHPDGHLPASIVVLANTAALTGDRESGARLRPLLEPMRSKLIGPAPGLGFAVPAEMSIGQLELLAGRPDAAVRELRSAAERADHLEQVWTGAWSRVDLARALHRAGDAEQALGVLSEAESISSRYAIGWTADLATEARAEIEGRKPLDSTRPRRRSRPIRALGTRGGRRALAALVRDLSDEELERRFAEPRRQRTLMRAMARGFQPSQAARFRGTIVYELQPFAIESPPDAPWRWAIEVDAEVGRAQLIEPAPLDPVVTIYFGLADWARVMAGIEDPLSVMVTGRCSVEGDVMVAARQEAMFGAG